MDDTVEEMDENKKELDVRSTDMDDSSGDSSESEDVTETQEKIQELKKQVQEWPLFYDGHVALIKALRDAQELLDARQAREEMNKHYPLTPVLWLEWIRDEQVVCSTEEERAFITSLMERAVKDYASVEVWTEYLLFSVGGGDVSAARDVAERALTAVGIHVRDGDLIWQAVLMVETQVYAALPAAADGIMTPEQQQVTKRIQGLIRRRFRVPLLNMDAAALVSEAETWFQHGLESYMQAELKKTLTKLKKLEPFEEQLLQSEDNDATNLAAYQSYLQYLLDSDGPAQLQNLYERAVLRHPLNAGLWLQYAQWASRQFGHQACLVLPVTGRATRNCPWSGELCGEHVTALQRCSDDPKALHKEIRDVVECCLGSLSTVQDGVAAAQHGAAIWHCYARYLWRCVRGSDEPMAVVEGARDDATSSAVNTDSAEDPRKVSSPVPLNGTDEGDDDMGTLESLSAASKVDADKSVSDNIGNKGKSNNSSVIEAKTDMNVTSGSSADYDEEVFMRRLREAFRRGVDMIRQASQTVPPNVPTSFEYEVPLCRLWAEAEAWVGCVDGMRAVWNELLAQAAYTGRHNLWLEFIELERRVGSPKHCRKLYRRALERVWEHTEAVGEAWERFEEVEGTIETMDDFYRRYKSRMKIVNKRLEELKSKELLKKAETKGNKKKGKQEKKEPNQNKTAAVTPARQSDSTGNSIYKLETKSLQHNTSPSVDASDRATTAASDGAAGPSRATTAASDGAAGPSRATTAASDGAAGPSTKSGRDDAAAITAAPANGNHSAAAAVPSVSSASAKPFRSVTPPPGYPGHSPQKRRLEEGDDEPPVKRLKVASPPTPAAVRSASAKVAVGHESRTVFVSNLNYATSINTVTAVFNDCGPIKDATLVKDFKGRSKGFGFVVFESQDSMNKALEKDRTPIGNRPMFVSTYEKDKQGHTFKYSTGIEKDKLYVRGLPFSMSEKEVREAFEEHAPVTEIRLVTHRNGYSKGTCFVKFADANTAEKVRQAMDKKELRGFTITVLISDPSAPARQSAPTVSHRDASVVDGNRHRATNSGDNPSSDPLVRKLKLAFVPRVISKMPVAARPQLSAVDTSKTQTSPMEESFSGTEEGESAVQKKTNEDFRKMLTK